ncbi:MAG: endolytic transglycosylase MltG [bacterium]|nr:endolytic transglycosylase MltG [bacterium]
MSISAFLTIIIISLVIFLGLLVYFFIKKQFLYSGLFSFFFVITFVFLSYNYFILFLSNDDLATFNDPQIFIVPKGAPLMKIASDLEKNDFISNQRHFIWSIRILGLDNKIKAGKYQIEPNSANYSLIMQLTSGEVFSEKITIAEGLAARDIASIYAKKLEVDSVRFLELVNDAEFVRGMGFDQNSLEGYLFPDTYFFTWGVTEKEIIETMVREFRKNITDDLLEKAAVLNFDLHKLVTLASIIEGEAVHDDERSKISAVFNNRLKQRWRLQADPTIQYIIPDGPRRLLNKDLAIDSPYNTYRYRGLPPGPINNPGIKSIIAAANPTDDTYMYFVATGEGYHTFSTTQAEHLKAKEILDRHRRENKKKSPTH